MKYKGKIYSCQVPEKLKTHEIRDFFTYKHIALFLLQNPPILVRSAVPIYLQIISF